jgi:hypothetical protein
VKVNDLQRQLDEGFLDNLVSKVQSMAGGDGPTGIIRALRGSNAALRKFADAITNGTRPRVMQRLGNQFDSINTGEAPLPVKLVYQQALAAAAKIAAADQMQVDIAQIGPTIKSNRADIERLVLSSNVGDNNQIKLILDAILGGTGTANIGMEFEPAMQAISMIVAATIVFIQTSQEDSESVEVDPNALEAFKSASVALNKVLFIQNSPDLQTLGPNDQLKDSLEELVTINMLTGPTGVQKRYLNLTTEQMQAALANVPQLVNPTVLSRILSSHSATVDAASVSAVVAKVEPLIQAQFKAWLEIAVSEQPPRAKAFDIYKQWAKTVYDSLDRMNFNAGTTAPAGKEIPQAGKEIPPAGTAGSDYEQVKAAAAELSPADKTKLMVDLSSDSSYGKRT